jgi:indolepyruvate ferredoxin oxidoreductase, beta subunit
MLVRRGYQVTIGETFGDSQRGGSVMSHFRYPLSADSGWSPQIPKGKADMVVTLEPIEAIRVLMNYGNPEIEVVTNTRPIYPVGVISGELNYPSIEEIQEAIRDLSSQAWFVEATDEAVKLGNPILGNIIMIGALAGTGSLPMTRDDFQAVIQESLPARTLEATLKAFDLGAAKIQ